MNEGRGKRIRHGAARRSRGCDAPLHSAMGFELLRASGVRCSRCGGCCTCVCGRQPLESLPPSTAFAY